MQRAGGRAWQDTRPWIGTRRELAGALVPGLLAAVVLWMSHRNGAAVDALIVVAAAVAGAVLTPLAVYVGSLLTANRRIVREEIETLAASVTELRERPRQAVPQRDPILAALGDALVPFVQEGALLARRVPSRGQVEGSDFSEDAERWANGVQAVLEDHPDLLHHFNSEAPLTRQHLDSPNWASQEFEHRLQMLLTIMKQVRPQP